MKIKQSKKAIPFAQLNPGEVFTEHGVIFMKGIGANGTLFQVDIATGQISPVTNSTYTVDSVVKGEFVYEN